MINVQFAAKPERWESYEAPLRAAFAEAGLRTRICVRTMCPRWWITWCMPPMATLLDFTPYTRCQGGAEPLGRGRETSSATPALTHAAGADGRSRG